MSRTPAFAIIVTIAFAAVLPAPSDAQTKPRVAVLNFDYSGVRAAAASALQTDQDLGAGVADILVQQLLKSGHFAVVERNALDAVLKEQNFSNSDRADAASAARIGRVLGVDAIVVGTVTQFAVQETNGAGGSFNRLTHGVLNAVQRNNARALVGINARLVNTSTAEIVTAATGTGESTASSTSVSGASSLAPVDMNSSAFSGSLVGSAVSKAAHSIAEHLNGVGGKLSAARPDYAGVIADVSGSTLIINIGTKAGVKLGDRVEITRVVRSVMDPQDRTRVIRTITEQVAIADVAQVDDQSATANMIDGKSLAKVGDVVKRAP